MRMTPGNLTIPDEQARNRWLVMVAVAMVIIFAFLLVSVTIIMVGRRIRSSPDADATGGGDWKLPVNCSKGGDWKLPVNCSKGGGSKSPANCSKIIHTACSQTFHPELCMCTLVTYPGVDKLVEPKDLVHLSIQATMDQLLRSYSLSVAALVPAAVATTVQDCVELLHDTIYHLNATLRAMSKFSGKNPVSILLLVADVKTWLSAALTNQDTCLEGFQNLIEGSASHKSTNDIQKESEKFSQLISNSLALFQTLFSNASLEILKDKDDRINPMLIEILKDTRSSNA